jgi:hypothetical protein
MGQWMGAKIGLVEKSRGLAARAWQRGRFEAGDAVPLLRQSGRASTVGVVNAVRRADMRIWRPYDRPMFAKSTTCGRR